MGALTGLPSMVDDEAKRRKTMEKATGSHSTTFPKNTWQLNENKEKGTSQVMVAYIRKGDGILKIFSDILIRIVN